MIIYLKVRDSSNKQITYHQYANDLFCLATFINFFHYIWLNYDLCFSSTMNQNVQLCKLSILQTIQLLHLPKSYNAFKQV